MENLMSDMVAPRVVTSSTYLIYTGEGVYGHKFVKKFQNMKSCRVGESNPHELSPASS